MGYINKILFQANYEYADTFKCAINDGTGKKYCNCAFFSPTFTSAIQLSTTTTITTIAAISTAPPTTTSAATTTATTTTEQYHAYSTIFPVHL